MFAVGLNRVITIMRAIRLIRVIKVKDVGGEGRR